MTALAVPPQVIAALGGRAPTEEQWRAISMPLEPCAIVAGAGSGKTSVMAARVAWLAVVKLGLTQADPAHGVLPGNVMCLTFTKSATENLAARVRGALASVDLPSGEEPVVQNYHSFAAQILERHGLLAGMEPGMRILTTQQRDDLAGRVLDRMVFTDVKAEFQGSVVRNILDLAEQAGNHLVPPEEIVAFNEERLRVLATHKTAKSIAAAARQRIELAHAVALYEGLKHELGVYDFSDQIRFALRVVQEHPEIVEDYRTRFEAVLLDEYQDTNVAQAQLIEAIYGRGYPLTAVGDPDQNIYAWRGASLYNLMGFTKQFPRADGSASAQLSLQTNFRSGATILRAADRLLEDLPPAQRPSDKRLRPWPANGDGQVSLDRFDDEWEESAWVADQAFAAHKAGTSWNEIAILCRKSRLFSYLALQLRERGIPAEIIGLAGLLKLPEIQEVLAYARAVADPNASVSLARILLGARYRVGYKDIARVSAWASKKNRVLRDTDEEDEEHGYLLAEALEHLDEIEGLSPEGGQRLEQFRVELAALRVQARRPVAEFLAEVIRRIGLLAELDAHLAVEPARAAKRNLAAFLDEVAAFRPLEGELSLRAFLEHTDAAERAERQDWGPAQPSQDESVKVMTVHGAKGLEFDVVFVPGLADGLLPDMTIQQNPAERGYSLDFELRGDHEVLPSFDGVIKQFKDDLRQQEEYEERRSLYVAMTRARKQLALSGAYWYGEGKFPKRESLFFNELAAWAAQTQDLPEIHVASSEPPDRDTPNPLIGRREEHVRDWPGAAAPATTDPLFPAGWRAAALAASTSASAGEVSAVDVAVVAGDAQATLIDALEPGEQAAYRAAAADLAITAAALREREATDPTPHPAITQVSPSSLIDYAKCPKRFYWSRVRPLPRFSGAAARRGTQVHRWIELRSMGQASLLEDETSPDLTAEELAGHAGGPGATERLQQTFLDSRFADAQPLYAERAFSLYIDGFTIVGRIDAVYGAPDGAWEIVDYKTSNVPRDIDEDLAWLQLDLYAFAAQEIWAKRPEELTLTYLFLGAGEERSRPSEDAATIRARISTSLHGIQQQDYEPTPGESCRWCDFRTFCDPGKAWLAGARDRDNAGA